MRGRGILVGQSACCFWQGCAWLVFFAEESNASGCGDHIVCTTTELWIFDLLGHYSSVPAEPRHQARRVNETRSLFSCCSYSGRFRPEVAIVEVVAVKRDCSRSFPVGGTQA